MVTDPERTSPTREPLESEDAVVSAETGTPAAVELEPMIDQLRDAMRLFMARLDIQVTEQFETDAARLKKRADRYWEAYTCAWGPKRHARILLVELLTESSGFRPDFVTSPKFPEAARAKMTRLIKIYRADIGAVPDPEVDAVWFSFWLPYPERARRLTVEDITTALRACRRQAGEGDGLGSRWDILAALCRRIGLQCGAQTLKKDWGKWREVRGEIVRLPDILNGRDFL